MILRNQEYKIMEQYILTLSCPDTTGIVASTSKAIANNQGWITSSQQHSDVDSNFFFTRMTIMKENFAVNRFCEEFKTIAEKFNMTWQISDTSERQKIVIFVSKFDHCLNDLLYRWRSNILNAYIVGIISNHKNTQSIASWYNIPFFYLPISKENKEESFKKVKEKLALLIPDLVVLARYMQILPDFIINAYQEKIINIHHSFLPSFKGPNPYKQAFSKGVKFVGATSHYVTSHLDEGPIIEQDTIRIDHRHTSKEIALLTNDVENLVLARAVKFHLEQRIMVHNGKTIVFA